jgi:hypothetical protein
MFQHLQNEQAKNVAKPLGALGATVKKQPKSVRKPLGALGANASVPTMPTVAHTTKNGGWGHVKYLILNKKYSHAPMPTPVSYREGYRERVEVDLEDFALGVGARVGMGVES